MGSEEARRLANAATGSHGKDLAIKKVPGEVPAIGRCG